MADLATRLKERANISKEFTIPFIHSGLFESYAAEAGIAVADLTDEQRQEAIKAKSQASFTVTGIPQSVIRKVIADASVVAKAAVLQYGKGLGPSEESTLFNRAFFTHYRESLLPYVIRNIKAWSLADKCDAANKQALEETLTLDEQISLCQAYEDAILKDKEQAEKNGSSSSAKGLSKD